MKKKIGIITHHNSYNYGAALQAYATILFLKEIDFETEIINYHPNYLQGFGTYRKTFSELSITKVNFFKKVALTLIKTPSYKRLKKRFDNFSDANFSLSAPYYSIEELKKDIPKCDAFCSGSDQVWNNYYTHAFDDAFFLDFVPEGIKCFSIASSFGKEMFDTSELSYIKNKLLKYDYLSIREDAGVQILKELGFKNVCKMLDPTLLVNLETWKKMLKPMDIKGPFILVYQLHGDSHVMNIARKFSKEKGIKIINIITMYHQIRIGSRSVIVPKIEEFIWLFSVADYVFTDSFHGTIFSLQFQRKLGVVLPTKFSNRITSLLNSIGGEKFILENLDKWKESLNSYDYDKIFLNLINLKTEKIKELKEYLETL